MRARVKHLLFVFTVLVANGVCIAGESIEFVCPKRIRTQQSVTTEYEGWKGIADQPFSDPFPTVKKNYSENNLENAWLSQGDDVGSGVLLPDNEGTISGKKFVAKYTLDPTVPNWMVCEYRATTVKLIQRIPSTIAKCFVSVDRTKPIGVKRVWCEK